MTRGFIPFADKLPSHIIGAIVRLKAWNIPTSMLCSAFEVDVTVGN
jgi:hypothetical protein